MTTPLYRRVCAVLYRGGKLILRFSATFHDTLLVQIGSPTRLLLFWCVFDAGEKAEHFVYVCYVSRAAFSPPEECTRPRVVGATGFSFGDVFSAIARGIARQRPEFR